MARQLQTSIVIGGKTSPSLNKAFQTAQNNAQKTSKIMSRIGGVIKTSAKVAATGITAIGASVIALGAKGLDTASDLTEVQNVVDTTFKDNAKAINTWSKTALEAYGLSTLQAKKYNGTLGAMMKSSGIASDKLVKMSTDLSGLTGDFASFYNVAQDDAFADLKSAMAGQTETMLKYGINMNVANLEAFALSKGIKASWQNMDLATQTQMRYLYIMEKSKDAQGDFTKTLDSSFANQKRVAVTRFNETLGMLAEKTLPIATNVLRKVNNALNTFTSNPQKVDEIADKISNFSTKAVASVTNFIPKIQWLVGTGIPNAISIIKALAPVIVSVTAGMIAWNIAMKTAMIIETLTKAWRVAASAIALYQSGAKMATIAQMLLNGTMLANPIFLIIAAIAGLVAGFVYLWNTSEKFRNFWIGLWNGIVNAVMVALDWIKNNWQLVLSFILNPFAGIFAALYKYNDGFRNWVNGVVEIIKQPINTLIGFINNSFIGGLNKLTIPDWVPIVGGKGITLPMIPKLAAGATVGSPTLAMIGEAGTETVVPHNNKPRSRALLAEAAAGVGSIGGSTIIHFSPIIQGGGDVKQQISDAYDEFEIKMDRYLARKRRLGYAL